MSYIDPSYPSRIRQSELSTRYHFDCTCEKCRLGSIADTDKYLKVLEELPKDWFAKRSGPALPRSITMQHPRGDAISSREVVEFIEDSVKSHLRRLEGSCTSPSKEDVVSYASLALRLQATKLFPSHRQPLAAVYHDFKLNRMDERSFVESFRLGLHLALDIHPPNLSARVPSCSSDATVGPGHDCASSVDATNES